MEQNKQSAPQNAASEAAVRRQKLADLKAAGHDPFTITNTFRLDLEKIEEKAWAYPLPDARVISPYGGARRHSGVDLKTKPNDEIYAAFDGVWEQFFTEKPEPLTREEKKAWIALNKGVSVGSDAFFPFGDNIERAHKSGVEYIAEAGGSIRDDNVIDTCDKYGIAMAFTHVRLFHH